MISIFFKDSNFWGVLRRLFSLPWKMKKKMKNSFCCFAKVIKIGRDRIRGVVKTHLYKPNKAWNNPTVPFLEETSKQKGAPCCGQFGTPGCSLLSHSALTGDAQPLRADSSGGDMRAAQPTSRRWHLIAPSTGSSWECRRKGWGPRCYLKLFKDSSLVPSAFSTTSYVKL